MATQATIQKHINFGYGKAAQYLGAPYQWFRPSSANNPLAQGNLQGVVQAHFDSAFNFGAAKPQQYNQPVWGVAVDRTLVHVSDYLVGPMGTFYVNATQPLLPSACVECNATLSLYRPGGAQGPSKSYYGGNPQGFGNPIMLNWPASVLNGTKGEASQSGVMGDTRLQWMAVLIPHFPGVLIKASDLLIDQDGRRMTISAVETSDLGYRITSQYSGT